MKIEPRYTFIVLQWHLRQSFHLTVNDRNIRSKSFWSQCIYIIVLCRSFSGGCFWASLTQNKISSAFCHFLRKSALGAPGASMGEHVRCTGQAYITMGEHVRCVGTAAGNSCVPCFIWHGDALSSSAPHPPFFLSFSHFSFQPQGSCVPCFICHGDALVPNSPSPLFWQGAKKCLGWLYPQHVDWVSPPSPPPKIQKALPSLSQLRRSPIPSCLSGKGDTL